MGHNKLKKKIKKLRSRLKKKDEEIARMEAIITEPTWYKDEEITRLETIITELTCINELTWYKDEEIARLKAMISELTCFGCGKGLEHCPCGVCDECSHNNSECRGCQKKFCRYCLYNFELCKSCHQVKIE